MAETTWDRTVVWPDDPAGRFWDPWWFLQMGAVRSRAGPLVPFHLWPHQMISRANVQRAYAERRWIVEVKARRIGYTSFYAGLAYQHAAYREGCHAAFLSYKRDATRVAMQVARTLHRTLPLEVQTRADARLKRTMEFPSVGGELTVHAVKDDEPLRGDAVHFLFTDELSSWELAGVDDVWTAARSSVPEEDGIIVAVSTPRYDDDPLHRVWKEAELPNSRWIQSFIPWTSVHEYAREPPVGWKEGEAVRDYRERWPISDAQAYWMEVVGLPKCANNVEKFRAEYPIGVTDAWGLKSDSIFDATALTRQLRALGGDALLAETEETLVWEARQPAHDYVVACDPAGSWAKRDYFAVVVLNLRTYAPAYEYRGHAEAWKVADELVRLSREYGNANVYVEANAVGEAVLSHLDVRGWPHLYRRPDGTPGWWSSARTRAEAVGYLQAHVADGSVQFRSARTVRQLLQYNGGWGRQRDEQGGHFDLVAVYALAAWAWVCEGGGVRRPMAPERIAEINYRRLLRIAFGPSPGDGVATPWGLHR